MKLTNHSLPRNIYTVSSKLTVFAKVRRIFSVSFLNKLSQCETFSLTRHKDISPRISGLLLSGRPAAIFWAIIAVVINSIKRVFVGGAITNILQEISKARCPSLANFDPAPTPQMILRGRRVCAAALHRIPCSIFRSSLRMPMYSARLRISFALQAAATARRSSPKVGTHHDSSATAVASAFPPRPTVFGIVKFKNKQASELLS